MLLSANKQLNRVINKATKAALFPVSVLITGESGVGKEVLAQYIHDKSDELRGRRSNFVGINCAAVPKNLLESELFGYKKGAFSGATMSKDGLFVAAGDGTILLDEIGDMPLELQIKILRCLETRTVTPIGGTAPVEFNARIIAATNQNLEKLIEEGKFRVDLLHRLNTIQLHIPPLRNRPEDIPLFFTNMLMETVSKFGLDTDNVIIDDNVYEFLKLLDWEGNVRELKNFTERLVVFCYDNSDTLEITLNNIQMMYRDESEELADSGMMDKAAYNRARSSSNIFIWDINTDGESLVDAHNTLNKTVLTALYDKYGSVAQAAAAAGISYPTAHKYLHK